LRIFWATWSFDSWSSANLGLFFYMSDGDSWIYLLNVIYWLIWLLLRIWGRMIGMIIACRISRASCAVFIHNLSRKHLKSNHYGGK
jgi:hypothetical protein